MNIINIEAITYLEGDINYTTINYASGDKVVSSYHLKLFEKLLIPFGFVRVHKSYIINRLFIHEIQTHPTKAVVLTDGKVLAVARRRSV